MSKLIKEDVLHVAKLSSLSLSEDEVQVFNKQLTEVLNYVEELNEVAIENTKPTAQTTGLSNVSHDDNVSRDRILKHTEAMSQAAKTHDGYFKVPPVIEKDHDDR